MNFLDYAYDLHKVEGNYESNSVKAYIRKIASLLNEDSSKEELTNAFMEMLLFVSDIEAGEYDRGYNDGYEDAKDEYECDCDYY